MKCPLIQPNYNCGEEECAWWLLYSECCAIKAIGELAQDENVERLEKEKQRLHVKSFAEAELEKIRERCCGEQVMKVKEGGFKL